MPSPFQNIETRLTALEAKIDQILAQPAVPPEVNLELLTAMLGQILGKTDQIITIVSPQAPVDLNAQAQQAFATLQAIQAQLEGQVNAINMIPVPIVPEPLPEPLIPEV